MCREMEATAARSRTHGAVREASLASRCASGHASGETTVSIRVLGLTVALHLDRKIRVSILVRRCPGHLVFWPRRRRKASPPSPSTDDDQASSSKWAVDRRGRADAAKVCSGWGADISVVYRTPRIGGVAVPEKVSATSRRSMLALWSCWLLSACAASVHDVADVLPNPAVPSNDEVIAYVQTNWSSYSERTSRFQRRPDEAASLIDVRAVSCGTYYGIPECSFTVMVSFGGGPTVDQRLSSQFDRYPDSKLFETIVLIHERRR